MPVYDLNVNDRAAIEQGAKLAETILSIGQKRRKEKQKLVQDAAKEQSKRAWDIEKMRLKGDIVQDHITGRYEPALKEKKFDKNVQALEVFRQKGSIPFIDEEYGVKENINAPFSPESIKRFAIEKGVNLRDPRIRKMLEETAFEQYTPTTEMLQEQGLVPRAEQVVSENAPKNAFNLKNVTDAIKGLVSKFKVGNQPPKKTKNNGILERAKAKYPNASEEELISALKKQGLYNA